MSTITEPLFTDPPITEQNVTEVIHEDLPSIGTLHERAFHVKSPWHVENFPASLSSWWTSKYELDIDDPAVHLLKISPVMTPNLVLGLLSLRKYSADEHGSGRWSSHPPPEELVNREIYEKMVGSMAEYREKYMLGKDHFCVDHFGVDSRVQGRGYGGFLLKRACEIADEEELDVFVEANEGAESFYQRYGFETEGKMELEGGMVECFLVRRFVGDGNGCEGGC